jgi:hypothetical protein
MPFQYSKPKRIHGTSSFTQRVFDRVTRQGYLAVLSLTEVFAQVRRGIKWDLDDK